MNIELFLIFVTWKKKKNRSIYNKNTRTKNNSEQSLSRIVEFIMVSIKNKVAVGMYLCLSVRPSFRPSVHLSVVYFFISLNHLAA